MPYFSRLWRERGETKLRPLWTGLGGGYTPFHKNLCSIITLAPDPVVIVLDWILAVSGWLRADASTCCRRVARRRSCSARSQWRTRSRRRSSATSRRSRSTSTKTTRNRTIKRCAGALYFERLEYTAFVAPLPALVIRAFVVCLCSFGVACWAVIDVSEMSWYKGVMQDFYCTFEHLALPYCKTFWYHSIYLSQCFREINWLHLSP